MALGEQAPIAEAQIIAAADTPEMEAAWGAFVHATGQEMFCAAWLAIICSQAGAARAGLLLGPDAESNYLPAALWPTPQVDLRPLVPIAERVVASRQGLLIGGDAPQLGYPIIVDEALRGVIVMELPGATEAMQRRALRQTHWASGWLVERLRSTAMAENAGRVAGLATVLELAATALQQHGAQEAALAVVNEMAARLGCARVSLGHVARQRVEVAVIAHTANFDKRMRLVRLLAEAMDEVLDFGAALVFPATDADAPNLPAHAALAHELGGATLCSVPLTHAGRTTGVITLERAAGQGFSAAELALCRSAGSLLGPILSLNRESERGALGRLGRDLRHAAGFLLGRRRPGLKLLILALAAGIAALALTPAPYRVNANMVLEGAVQRAAVAPFDGHIAATFVRAGDTVHADDPLCRMDDRDLQLELRQHQSERQQVLRRQRQALAEGERGEFAVLTAQLAESDAAIALLQDKLDRATLRAPFDGVVISGDVDQLLGAPVEQGKLLFQVAPLDQYRVILQVDERDIAAVREGLHGAVTLSALPDQSFGFAVRRITSLASQKDGQNYFRIEAQLDAPSPRLRPGMEGVGKIDIGQRHLLWIWTHRLVDWLTIWIWRNQP